MTTPIIEMKPNAEGVYEVAGVVIPPQESKRQKAQAPAKHAITKEVKMQTAMSGIEDGIRLLMLFKKVIR